MLFYNHTWETVSIDWNSINDPLEVPADISEPDKEEERPASSYQRRPVLQRGVDQLLARGLLTQTSQESTAAGRELVREERTVPDLPERLRGGSKVDSSSGVSAAASSSDPRSVQTKG